MFIYLSKKIAIPNNIKLNCLAWNKDHGYIAVGGNDGLLKVLKLDSAANNDNKSKGLAAPSNLSMNQTLEGHTGEVQVIVWNEVHHKLTTSDQNGLIIVWMLYKGSWYEEMINNRNKSVVKGMAWSHDGQKICIAYEDGAVIVGSVDGNRIWGKEMKNTRLSAVQWASQSKALLFGLQTGEVHIYDTLGNFTTKLGLHFNSMVMAMNKMIIGLEWYNGKYGLVEENCPVFVVCYYSGHMQLMRSDYDDNPILVDTNMTAISCKWNHNGSVLAVVGSMVLPGENHESNVIQFFSPFGLHMRTLKVPGDTATSCAWEGGSLRVALTVDSHIYFANIRPDYKWTSMNSGRVVVYAYTKSEHHGTNVCFWDTKTSDTYVKQVPGLLGLAANGNFCVLASRDQNRYKIMLCNSISTLVDTRQIEIEPVWLAMNSTHVFVASKNNFLTWAFKIPKLTVTFSNTRKERVYHVDDIPTGVADVIHDLDASYVPDRNEFPATDPISCIAAADQLLLVGRESGLVQQYALPHVALIARYSFPSRPYTMSINCDGSKFALIDISGVLTFQAVQETNDFSIRNQVKTGTGIERRDVWALCWAADNPTLLATMEKTRMYVLRNEEPEEPIVSAGYVCCFKDLQITSVLLDEIMKSPEQPSSEYVNNLEVKSLRDTRDLLDKVGIAEATTFIEDNPHPRLWKLLAEAALQKMDLVTAESAFVRFSDYQGLQFIKKLKNMHSTSLQSAEIAAYRGDFEAAEKIYIEMERIDLAIELRERLGDWFRVSQLMNTYNIGSDLEYEKTNNALGDYYVDHQNWKAAREHFTKAKNVEKEVICLYMLEDWDSLKNVAGRLTEKHPLLKSLGHMLAGVGLCDQATQALIKAGDVESAIDVCVAQTHWAEATRLAVKYKQEGVAQLLASNAKQLIEAGRTLEAVDFLCKAQQYIEAGKFLFNYADREKQKKSNSPLYLKKLYVLAALIIEEKQRSRISELSSLNEGKTSEFVLEPWRAAEAYHFLMLTQRLLQRGDVDAALVAARSMSAYEDTIGVLEVQSLTALAAAASHHYATCSRAMGRLESCETSETKKKQYITLALDLFSRNPPKDPKSGTAQCGTCLSIVTKTSASCPACKTVFPICVATGAPILNTTVAWTCSVCRHYASAPDMSVRKSCPLCHTPTG